MCFFFYKNRRKEGSIPHFYHSYSQLPYGGSLYEDNNEPRKGYISLGNSSLIYRRISSFSFPSRSVLLGHLLCAISMKNFLSMPAFAKSGMVLLSVRARVRKGFSMLARQTYDQWAGDHSSAMIETVKFIQSDDESPQKRKSRCLNSYCSYALRYYAKESARPRSRYREQSRT